MDDNIITLNTNVNPKQEKDPMEHLLSLINKNVNRQGNLQQKVITSSFEKLNSTMINMNKSVDSMNKSLVEVAKKISELDLSDDTKEITMSKKSKKINEENSDSIANTFKELTSVWEGKTETNQEKSLKGKEEEKKEAKRASLIDKLLGTVGSIGKMVGLTLGMLLKKGREKLDDYGLLGKGLGKLMDVGGWFLGLFGKVGKSILPNILKLAPKLLSKLLPIAAIGMAVAGAFSKVKEMFEHGFSETVAKDQKALEDAFEGGFFNGLMYCVTHPIDALVGFGGKLADWISDAWNLVSEPFTKFFGWIGELPGKLWDKVRSILPTFLGGKSDEEIEEEKKAKELGLTPEEYKEFNDFNRMRREDGAEDMSVEDYKRINNKTKKAKEDAEKKRDPKQEREIDKQISLENYYKKDVELKEKKKNVAKNPEAKKEANDYTNSIINGTATKGIVEFNKDQIKKYGDTVSTDIKQPAINVKQPEPIASSEESKQPIQQTTIINNNNSNSGIELEDVIGSSSVVAINMTRN